MAKRFDAPTSFSPVPAAAPCGCNAPAVVEDGTMLSTIFVEDAGEDVVEKAQREARERTANAWKKSSTKPRGTK